MEHKKFLRIVGAKGGRAGRGKKKARTTEQARAAALVRWEKPTVVESVPERP